MNIQTNEDAPMEANCSCISNKNSIENPNIKPLAKTIIPATAKQKYVNPDMKIKNIWDRSVSEAFNVSIK